MRTIRLYFLMFCVFVLPAPSSADTGGVVDNGGGGVACHAGPESPLDGFYALDYALTFDYETGNSDLVEVDSWRTHMWKVMVRFIELYRFTVEEKGFFFILIGEIRNFIGAAEGDRIHKGRTWVKGSPPPRDGTAKENQLLPANCKNADNKVKIISVVQRLPEFENTPYTKKLTRISSIQYLYDEATMELLEETNPIQSSFMMMHEWLWDEMCGELVATYITRHRNCDDPLLRTMNRYFHTKRFIESEPDEVLQELRRLGFFERMSEN